MAIGEIYMWCFGAHYKEQLYLCQQYMYAAHLQIKKDLGKIK